MRKASEMQLKAINHVKGPARVIAGPGSGKTFTIVQRIQNLIFNHQINPDRILTITFTRAAAIEMQSRYLKESENNPTGNALNGTVHFGTFHGICYTILKESGLINHFSLIRETEKRKIIEIILKNKGIDGADEYDNISRVLDFISRKKNFCETEQFPLALTRETFDDICFSYEDMMNQQKLLDFDDMILMCLNHLKENPVLCKKWQDRFSFILVDEFQDINEVQYQVVKLLAGPAGNLFVVGDDDQSIYGFRGSAPGIMRKFTEDYQETRELFLTENYRSGNEIIELADLVIRRNHNRFEKNPVPMRKGGSVIWEFRETRKEEEDSILKDIRKLSEEQLKDSAVIVRTNAEAFQYSALLKQHGIPVRERMKQKESPLQSFIAEDFKAFLRFCHEGNRRSDFLKIMNKPNLFLSRQALLGDIVRKESFLAYYENNREMCLKINSLFRNFQTASELSPFLAVRFYRKVMGYDVYLKQKAVYGKQKELAETADYLQESLKRMEPGEKTDEFFERLQKEQEGKNPGNMTVSEGISVITMHGAKGLEFHSVFLPDLNEGIIPGKNCKT
ncbi:MAG: ATP-dependent helicase, partial [Suilimivivens sp.]